ncbi:hypothetical protein A3A59_01430 [Candidatus Gottesmanbacteria bacterium RIFCSPLOWO2_01_FULL_42_10]|nr:MAG: hypothetical protein A3A59_01430 [Candidatus Gottesmanbacteria bacterium RIFCSPLOWO2_01_FULL_42_10]
MSFCGVERKKSRAQKIAEARRVGAPRWSKRGRRPTVPCRSLSEGGANQMRFDIFRKPPASKEKKEVGR